MTVVFGRICAGMFAACNFTLDPNTSYTFDDVKEAVLDSDAEVYSDCFYANGSNSVLQEVCDILGVTEPALCWALTCIDRSIHAEALITPVPPGYTYSQVQKIQTLAVEVLRAFAVDDDTLEEQDIGSTDTEAELIDWVLDLLRSGSESDSCAAATTSNSWNTLCQACSVYTGPCLY